MKSINSYINEKLDKSRIKKNNWDLVNEFDHVYDLNRTLMMPIITHKMHSDEFTFVSDKYERVARTSTSGGYIHAVYYADPGDTVCWELQKFINKETAKSKKQRIILGDDMKLFAKKVMINFTDKTFSFSV